MYTILHASRYLKLLTLVSNALFQFWSLSFSKHIIPPFCISEKLSAIHIQLFELLVATYPLALVIIACLVIELHSRKCVVVYLFKLFEPILKKAKNKLLVTSDAVFHAFASLFLLSNFSVMVGFIKLVEKVKVLNSTGVVQEQVLILDPTVKFLDGINIMYLLIALVPCLLSSVLPSLLLVIYPTQLYRYLCRLLSTRKQLAITAFAEAIHSCLRMV